MVNNGKFACNSFVPNGLQMNMSFSTEWREPERTIIYKRHPLNMYDYVAERRMRNKDAKSAQEDIQNATSRSYTVAIQLFIIYYKFYWLRNWFRFEGNHKTLISLNVICLWHSVGRSFERPTTTITMNYSEISYGCRYIHDIFVSYSKNPTHNLQPSGIFIINFFEYHAIALVNFYDWGRKITLILLPLYLRAHFISLHAIEMKTNWLFDVVFRFGKKKK